MKKTELNLDALLFELSVACPLHGGNPKTCQLYELRKKSVLERLSYIAELSQEKKMAMIKCHEECFEKKHGPATSE